MIPNSTDAPDDRPLDDEELRRLSAFTEFIDTLNLEDLGDEKPSGASE